MTSREDALELFDSLEPVDIDFMIGRWQGEGEISDAPGHTPLIGVEPIPFRKSRRVIRAAIAASENLICQVTCSRMSSDISIAWTKTAMSERKQQMLQGRD